MERELVLDLKDLTRIGVTCANCTARIVINTTEPKCQAPAICPSCSQTFYQDSPSGATPLDGLIRAIREQRGKHTITLHLPSTPLQP
jgi:hypothetical protein